MKKVSRFLLMAAVAVGMVACSNDLPVDNGGEEGTGTVWAAFTVALPNASGTRAAAADVGTANGGDTYVGTTDEQKIGGVRVVLYDGTNVAYSWDLAATTDGAATFTGADVSTNNTTNLSKARFVTVARKVAEKPYQALVIMNPTATVKAVTNVGDNLFAFQQAVVNTTPAAMITNNAILMTNEQGLVPVAVGDLKTTNLLAEAAPVVVKVDRILAKIFVGTPAAGVATVDGATVSGLQWTPNVTNKKTFWMRNLGLLANGTQEAYNDGSARWDRYAVDPNFTGGYNTATATALVDEFNYKTTAAGTVDLGAPGFADANGKYVLENTMAAAEQFEVATTQVILKAVYTPAGLTAGASWASYKGYALSLADFNAKVAAAQVAGATDGSVGMPAGFVADMAGKSAYGDVSAVDGNVKVYQNGVSYYTILVRHFDDVQASWNGQLPYIYGRYGVVRNNIYKITVNSIKRPGEPVVTDPDPEDPDDEKELWVSFDIEVLPWLVRTQSVDL